MTVLIYGERAKHVGDLSASRFAKADAAEASFAENDPRVALEDELIGSPARTGGQEKAAAG